LIKKYFVNPSIVVNRTPTINAFKALSNAVASSKCQCVSCRQCDNHCNK